MSNDKKKDIRNIIILMSIFLLLIFVVTRSEYVYGSKIDWESQHFNFAEYFRNLFYETHNLFPSFAFNIGAGENIYNFSYYGFLNPIILLSYLFPFIKMSDYIIITSILCIAISVILLYKWLRNNKFSSNISFFSSLLFLFSSLLILHSHRHIMFINYMPFLLLGLICVDSYFNKSKKFGLILSVFLIIMTSYYYSIPSIFTIVIYAIYCYIKKEDNIKLKSFLKDGIKFLSLIFVAILSSSILLIPTFYAILNSRVESSALVPLKDILIPNFNLNYLLYSSYSVGLTSISIFSIVHCVLSKNKENKFLSIVISIILLFPIIIFILNGFLYVNSKVLIPFLPLCILLISYFINDLFNDKVNIIKVIIPTIIISIIFCLTIKFDYIIYFIIDVLITVIIIILYKYKKIKYIIIIPTSLLALSICLYTNLNDKLMKIEEYDYVYSDEISKLYDEILSKSDNIYRSSNLVDSLVTSNKVYNSNYYSSSIYSSTYNSLYKNFYINIFNNSIPYRNNLILNNVDSILWDTFMGVKYIVTDKDVQIGYQEKMKKGSFTIYENNNVFPIAYVNSNTISRSDFDKLSYPYNVEALLSNVVVENKGKNNYNSKIEKINLNYNNIQSKNVKIDKGKNIKIVSEKHGKIEIPLERKIDNEILIIRFNMNYEQSCEDKDTRITINGVTNTLSCKTWKYKNNNKTFDYVISSNSVIDKLVIEFKKGMYNISNIETYLMSYDDIKKYKEGLDEFVFDKDKTKADVIYGNINVTKDGYFNISIPYDKGFKAYVNGKEVKIEKVNDSFMGFPLKKGKYNIKFVYTSPMRNVSIYISVAGVLLSIIILLFDIKNKNKLV